MPLPGDLHMRAAVEQDLPAIAELREAVGWAAHDWALRAVLDPSDARCLVVHDGQGRMVGVGSGITYGALGWVGNMVVAEAQRRRGVGAAVLEAIVGFLLERGCERLELFATPSGRPLYARHGFALTDPSAMVLVAREAPLDADPDVEVGEAISIGELAEYDAPRFGGDRRRLLGMMAADAGRPLLAASRDGAIEGYAWLRPDGPRIGPLLADNPSVAAALLSEAFRRAPDADELSLNLPASNVPGMRWLAGLGATIEPWDGRMARGPEIPRRYDTIYANTVGALG